MRPPSHALRPFILALALLLPGLYARAENLRAGQVFQDCEECPEMVVIPAGAFDMGQPAGQSTGYDNAKPVHRVSIARPYALGKTEITKKQWRAVMGVNPSGNLVCDDCPAENLSWNAAKEFLRRLSVKAGKQYRLPSEAEWEYACRAGGQHAYCGSDDIESVAWYEGNSNGGAHPVAGKKANAFGLHDMSGNAWEWTADCWNHGYSGAPNDGSPWLAGGCSSRVVRGGSWFYRSQYQATIIRSASGIDDAGSSDGLRVARSLP